MRASRQAQSLTIAQVAQATGLNSGFLSRIERDETSPSVATLVSLCEVLSLSIGSLFEEIDTDVVHLADAPRINLGGRGASERLITPRTQSRVQCVRSSLAEGADGGTELYTINCDVEVLHVITGQITLVFSTHDVTLDTGDTLTFNGHEPHTWRNTAADVTEVVWTIVPAAWSGSS
ncbi:helix-turn-helix domain-containing protein [Microbacterium kribbense]|uniref:Helix-turn-helix domain-containing protein n=1 Tax=Microbacterium kribbense TaxID=433645 RepID=A0ABP7G1Z0_9MICO